MSKTDLVRAHHMLDAAHEVLEFSTGKSRSDLDIDRMLNLSLVHLLEIIGEAAVGMSPEFRKKYPQVPWNVIAGMRNRLIHGYYDIDLDIVWKTVERDIPPLVTDLEKIIANEEDP
ncbi:MAG TPA: DUF86 domain-containing protein [Thermoplasmata archaeon]|nr:DUF86 domain-containing protein [Thermoplasmata archaeon]